MGKKHHQHQRQQNSEVKPDLPPDQKENLTNSDMETAQEKILGVVVHKSRIDSNAEQFVTRGVLRDVQEKFLQLLGDVDENHSIAIGLTIVPSTFEFPKEESTEDVPENNQDAELRNVSDADGQPGNDGTEPVRTPQEGNDGGSAEAENGTSTGDAGSEKAITEKLELPHAPDPFADVQK